MSRVGSEAVPKALPKAVKERLDTYRALLRRDAGAIPELERLVSMLESELRGAPEVSEDRDRLDR